jgi:hypothetical protein
MKSTGIMQTNFNLENFIKTYVTARQESLLSPDFTKYQTELNTNIELLQVKEVLLFKGGG